MRTLWIAIILSLVVLATLPSGVQAQGRINLMACRDLTFQDLGASGSQITPVACSREFATSVPYVVLYIELAGIGYPTVFTWQLLDPTDQVYARFRRSIDPPPGYTWTYYFYSILPVASTEKDIVEKNPRFRFAVVEVGATPVSQMPGEWKMRATMDGAVPVTLRFSLKP